jgi:Tfp pilus assembly protein PilF
MYRTIALVALATAFWPAGCYRGGKVKNDYATVTASPDRDTAAARRHTGIATKLMEDGKLDDARKELKAALAADLFFGPAHNNLGSLYLKQKSYYLAAWEFQYAAKLMPHQAQPRNNLGMVFETVGRLDEAQQWYDKALALSPEAVEIAANLARIHTRKNINNERTRELLAMVVMKDKRSQWVKWARQRLALIGQPKASPLPLDDSAPDRLQPETQPAKPK